MRSFNFLTLAATAACTIFASAAPLTPRGGLIDVAHNQVDPKTDVDVLSPRGGLPAPGGLVSVDNNQVDPKTDVDVLSPRGGLVSVDNNQVNPDTDVEVLSPRDNSTSLKSIPMILNDLLTDLGSVVDELNSIVTGNCTKDIVDPLLQQVVDIVGAAVSDIGKLAGQPVSVILATVDGTAQIAVSDLAQLLCKVLTLVVNALGALLKVLNGDLSILGDVVQAVGDILCQLVKAVTGLVDGLLEALLPLVGGLLGTLTSLAFTTLGGLLGGAL